MCSTKEIANVKLDGVLQVLSRWHAWCKIGESRLQSHFVEVSSFLTTLAFVLPHTSYPSLKYTQSSAVPAQTSCIHSDGAHSAMTTCSSIRILDSEAFCKQTGRGLRIGSHAADSGR